MILLMLQFSASCSFLLGLDIILSTLFSVILTLLFPLMCETKFQSHTKLQVQSHI
jgi:hypothetical protein